MRGLPGRLRGTSTGRAQTETIGMVIILSMTLIGATVAVGVGATVLNDARADSNEEGIRNAMTQLDSRTAQVALGDSTAQHVTLPTGSYLVDSDAGWINVTHINHSGNGQTEVIYNDSLGAVRYEGDEVTIAYQGGGVWQSTANASSMISPPEFHYRGATLTLPIIRLMNADSRAGGTTAQITADGAVRRIYPNGSDAYAGGSPVYQNPVEQGNVSVEIHSTYYQAWATYFQTRSDGEVTVFHNNETVRILLFTPSSIGDFDMPADGNGISPSGVGEDHPVDEFEITLKSDGNFQQMHWGFYAEEGGEEFEIHIFSSDQCAGGYDDDLDISIYYYNGTGSTYEGWQNKSVSPDGPFITVDCAAGEMHVDFMASSQLLTYKEINITGGNNKWHFGNQINSMSVESSLTLDQHPDVTGEPATYDEDTDEEQIDFLVSHYFGVLGPNFELKVTDGPGQSSRVDEAASTGRLAYEQDGGAQFITFLHITENRVTVELD